MTIPVLITDLATRADDLLVGVTDRTVARALLQEELTLDYPDLTPARRAEIVAGVITALERDDFFGWEFCGDPFADEPEPADAEDL
ncbi:MAG: hypothetical protein H7343_12360 [Undibacterium sp.]|nr:hypothetical protein [Opitutaceae bacterium]